MTEWVILQGCWATVALRPVCQSNLFGLKIFSESARTNSCGFHIIN